MNFGMVNKLTIVNRFCHHIVLGILGLIFSFKTVFRVLKCDLIVPKSLLALVYKLGIEIGRARF